ncbi:MAG TPA: hypothetical protein VJU60_11845 [Thermoleophilaceae bacterium]|nr:hypothetical protein [Thermoleophilaceae bacterium]
MQLKKSSLIAAVCACVALAVPAAASAKFPAVRAVVTITGQTTGSQTLKVQVPPQAGFDCPAQDTTEQETGTVSWKATFKRVIVPLRKTGFVLKNSPRGKGGVSGGSYQYSGTYLKDDPNNQDACPVLASTSASATIFNKPPPSVSWDDRELDPNDIFYLGYPGGTPTNIHANPPELDVAKGEFDGDPSSLVPIDPANDLPIYDVTYRPRQQTQALDASVMLNWNKLQRRIRPLARGHSVTLQASTNVDNSHKPVPFDQDCPDVGPPSGPNDYGILSCAESMSVHYTIKIRPTGPAHGCDIATAKHCLI